MPFILLQKNYQYLHEMCQSLECVVSLVRSFFLPFPLCLRNFCIFLMVQAHIVWSSKPISVNTMPLLLSLPWEQTLIILLSLVQDHIHFGSVDNSIIGFQLCFLFQTKLLHLPSSISMIQINNWITERGTTIIPWIGLSWQSFKESSTYLILRWSRILWPFDFAQSEIRIFDITICPLQPMRLLPSSLEMDLSSVQITVTSFLGSEVEV